tara:strand:+ start:315 stop:938 length:624 start_codon:yes stop_codon:yes gene_type:complete
MNQKTLILILTIFISLILSLYISLNELNENDKLNDGNRVKTLNRGEEGTRLRSGYERIGRLQFKKIENWIRQQPSSKMRIAQYLINVSGYEGELVVFSGIGGTPDQNINRWYKQFKVKPDMSNSEGLLKWDVISNGFNIKFVHFEGTYMKSDMQMNRISEELENYGLLAAIIIGAHEPYYFKMTGPNLLINSQKNIFEDFIKSVLEV